MTYTVVDADSLTRLCLDPIPTVEHARRLARIVGRDRPALLPLWIMASEDGERWSVEETVDR